MDSKRAHAIGAHVAERQAGWRRRWFLSRWCSVAIHVENPIVIAAARPALALLACESYFAKKGPRDTLRGH